MPGLLRDRYFEYLPDQAWDLVTGEVVSASSEGDEEGDVRPPAGALAELLEHGVEGTPRWVVTTARPTDWLTETRAIAAEARHRGYVAVSVDVLLRARLLLGSELQTRAIVLIAGVDTPVERIQLALLHAAALSPRPHLLISVAGHRSDRVIDRWRAAEARAVYGEKRSVASAGVRSVEVTRLLEKAARASDFVQSGRHAAAERLLREIAAALVRRQARADAANVYVTLGRLILERGKASAAESVFAEAAIQAEGIDLTLVMAARTWQAAARTDAGQLTAAEALCRAVLVANPPAGEQRSLTEATLGRVFLWQGRISDACALPFVRDSTGPCFAAATAVRLLIEAGELFEAGCRARDLLDRMGQAESTDRLIALTARLRVLLACGDMKAADEHVRLLTSASRTARSPVRLARVRLEWSRALRRAGRTGEADRELRMLIKMRAALPPLLRSAIERASRGEMAPARNRSLVAIAPGNATELVARAQREQDDGEALKQIAGFVLRQAAAARVEFWTADAGPATAVVSTGAGMATQLGRRALEAGTVVGPEVVQSGWELAVPVRLGTQLMASLAARWPADRACPDESTTLLTLAGAVAAPRVDSLIHSARQTAQAATAIPELVGVSAAISDVRRAVVRASAAPFSVLIEGESGVGKELVARAIHQLGPRRDRRFCDVNCAALPDDLFESELFGHARGAFTGAVSDRAGLIEDADGGTLFLDEVADLSVRAQAKLLRVLQQQEVRRVGETFSRKVDVRFVSAANRDLRSESEAGRFRQDLRYRLDVIRIHIPPLRERPEDIPSLARHFWAGAAARVNCQATLTHGVLAALARYRWPGNVRELQNVMAALAVEAPMRGSVRATLLPAAMTGALHVVSARFSDARLQWERRFVEAALALAGGNRSRAARDLGLTRQGLLKVLQRVGLLQSTDSEKNAY